MTERIYCSLACRNYLAHARVWAASIKKHDPRGKCYVLIVDANPDEPLKADDYFEAIRLSDLEDQSLLQKMAFRYVVFEFNCALKPLLLKKVAELHPGQHYVYIDIDTWVLGNFDELWEALPSASILLSPHVLEDYPEDQTWPNLSTVLMNGIYNGGLIAVGSDENSKKFINWWWEKLKMNCYYRPSEGYVADQRYLDMVPSLFNAHVFKHPGYNVAFWNYHEREVQKRDGKLFVNQEPFQMIHFSRFNPKVPELPAYFLPSSQKINPYVRMPELQNIADAYGKALLDEGYEECKKTPYAFSTFRSGYPISNAFRRHCKDHSDVLDGVQNLFENKVLERLAKKIDFKNKIIGFFKKTLGK